MRGDEQGQAQEVIAEKELVFIAAGMGGGTGTGAAPVIAEIAKDAGRNRRFRRDRAIQAGEGKDAKAKWGLEQLAAKSDTVIVIENDRLVSYVPNLPITDAFNLADAITGKAITGIADTIMLPSLMNIDFADVKSVMENGGFALISMGEGRRPGQDRAGGEEHPRAAAAGRFPEGAKGALLHINGGTRLTLGRGHEIGEKISENFDLNADVKIGARLDPSLGDTITCTAIVTGLKNPYKESTPKEETSRSMHMESLNYL